MTNTALRPQYRDRQFVASQFCEVLQPAVSCPEFATTVTRPFASSIAKSAVPNLNAATSTKPCEIRVRAKTRQAAWECQARAYDIHGLLGNLHLRYESFLVRNNGRPRVPHPYIFSKAEHTSIEHAVTSEATEPIAKRGRGRPKKLMPNRLKPYLNDYIFPREALERLPMFDDIVTGAVRLDAGGNTRPLSKMMMVSLLQVLDEVSAQAIQEDKQLSLRHSQRIAMCLRIIESASFEVAQKHWHMPSEASWPDLD